MRTRATQLLQRNDEQAGGVATLQLLVLDSCHRAVHRKTGGGCANESERPLIDVEAYKNLNPI